MYCPRHKYVKPYVIGGGYHQEMDRFAREYDLALLFAALADRTRLRLLNLMDGREVCVCYFVEILGQSQPKISRHLAYLRRAGVAAARREGKWMHYKITVPLHTGAARVLRETLTAVREGKTMKTDLARLAKACSAPQRLCRIEGAPLPIQVDHKPVTRPKIKRALKK
jgi:ArsR family transcriptional regulator